MGATMSVVGLDRARRCCLRLRTGRKADFYLAALHLKHPTKAITLQTQPNQTAYTVHLPGGATGQNQQSAFAFCRLSVALIQSNWKLLPSTTTCVPHATG